MIVEDPRLARLWIAAHRRLERSGGGIDGASIRLAQPDDDERAALDRLLGRRSRGRDVTVRLAELDAVLRRAGTSLVDIVHSKVGEVRDLVGDRARATAADEALWSSLGDHRALVRHPALAAWLTGIRAAGRWRSLDVPAQRLSQALDVLATLPLDEPASRKRFAADVVGSSHALDDRAPVGRLVLQAMAHLTDDQSDRRAASRRRLWSSFGVAADETSSTVLTVGLRPLHAGPMTEAADRWADAGTAFVIPLAAVEGERWRVMSGSRVWVCENPEVLAAGAGLDVPLVCVEGRPSVAAERLLASLVRGGARLAYHGDFGSGGVAIANTMVERLGAEPWRMSTADHAEALDHARAAGAELPVLRAEVPEAVWDAELAVAITGAGVEVEEELVLPQLVDDLRRRRA